MHSEALVSLGFPCQATVASVHRSGGKIQDDRVFGRWKGAFFRVKQPTEVVEMSLSKYKLPQAFAKAGSVILKSSLF